MRPTRPSARAIAIAACIVMLGGCTTVKGWFGGNKNKEAKPAPLVEFTPSLNVVKMWTVDLGEGEERIGVRSTCRPASPCGAGVAARTRRKSAMRVVRAWAAASSPWVAWMATW